MIKANRRDALALTLEVYPSKISYKEDYDAIINEIFFDCGGLDRSVTIILL